MDSRTEMIIHRDRQRKRKPRSPSPTPNLDPGYDPTGGAGFFDEDTSRETARRIFIACVAAGTGAFGLLFVPAEAITITVIGGATAGPAVGAVITDTGLRGFGGG